MKSNEKPRRSQSGRGGRADQKENSFFSKKEFSRERDNKPGVRKPRVESEFSTKRDNPIKKSSDRSEPEFFSRFKKRQTVGRDRSKSNLDDSPRFADDRKPREAGKLYANKREKEFDPNAKYSKKKQLEHIKASVDPSRPMRLNRFLANAGFCSRREADNFIKAGVVTVNGTVVSELGAKVIPAKDKVLFHEQLVRSEKKVYVLLNKPKDCVTTTDDPNARITVMDLVKNACNERIYPVGRLDRNTTGVLLLTNDGDMAAKLTHPKYNKKKIYHVFLDKPLTKLDMQRIATGIELEDGLIQSDEIHFVEDDDKKQVGIEIHSGRNRIVRRIFEHLGYKVIRLDRVYFAGLTKKNLPRGKWRFLSEQELAMLRMGSHE